MQVELPGPVVVESVAITINSEAWQQFTIFVIELLESSKALYKPCSRYKLF